MAATKRIFGYDLAKCFAMFFVVAIHYMFSVGLYSDTFFNNAFAVLACLGVPLFFAVNGALLFSKPLDIKKHYIKTGKILLIVLAWRVISVFGMSLITHANPFEHGGIAFVGYLLLGNLDNFAMGHFWFMYALVALYLVFPVLKICHDSRGGGVALSILLATVFFFTAGINAVDSVSKMLTYFLQVPRFPIEGLSQLNIFGAYGYTLLYFVGGGLIGSWMKSFQERSGRPASNIVLVCLFLASWAALFAVQRFQAATEGVAFLVQNGYWDVFTVIMTACAFLFMARLNVANAGVRSVFAKIGNNTLGIYFLHMFFITILSRLAPLFNGPIPFLCNIALILLIYLISFGIAYCGSKIPGVKALFKI